MATAIIFQGRRVTREAVDCAIDECERLGTDHFLSRHGFGRRYRFRIQARGRGFPAKAILGRAAGLASSEFSGGAHHVGRALCRLAFRVVNIGAMDAGPMAGELEDLRQAVVREFADEIEPVTEWPELPEDPTAYFASGSNRPSEIRGLGFAGADIGVTATELSPAGVEALASLAESDIAVFVDSGAFSEVEADEFGTLRATRPFSDEDWNRILDVQTDLSDVLGPQAWIVAPDRVGCARSSLERLSKYSETVRLWLEAGANVLVPIQGDPRGAVAYAAAVDRILGRSDWIPAFPCKKGACEPEDVRWYLRARQTRHVHLLGLGPRSRNAARFAELFAPVGEATYSCDSCWIASKVGRKGGRGGGPRPLTRVRDAATTVLAGIATAITASQLAIYTLLGR